jgi:hypothetical protein
MQNGPTRGATGRERRRSLYIPGWSFPFLTQNESQCPLQSHAGSFLGRIRVNSQCRNTLATVRLLLVAFGLDVFCITQPFTTFFSVDGSEAKRCLSPFFFVSLRGLNLGVSPPSRHILTSPSFYSLNRMR